ncbi:phosphoribosylformylglycinamidine cyclo-ligase [Caldicellulosiruptoraceae bacterium PP1]
MTTYKDAGVNIHEGYRAVEKIKNLAKSTYDKNVLIDIGSFGSMYSLHDFESDYILVSGTDGVGTKLKIAFLMDKHDTIGIDCVAMCVNDVVSLGAKPLFFLDYFACGKLKAEKLQDIIKGISEGCKQSSCSLIGGETAEMPGFYKENEYDLAGFCVGIVHKDKAINPSKIKIKDALIAIKSSGVHSNGFSLIRKVFNVDNNPNVLNKYIDSLGTTLGEELLKPTKIYVKAILSLISEGIDVHGIAHITGGGFYENIPRMLPKNMKAVIKKETIDVLPIFKLVMQEGNIEEKEMFSTFNMGVGMVIAVSESNAEKTIFNLNNNGYEAYIIGEVNEGQNEVEII